MIEEGTTKNIIINLIIIIVLIVIIRLIKGPLNINTTHNNLTYSIAISNTQIDRFNVKEEYKSPIIPYFIYKKDISNYNYNLHTNTYFSKQDKYILKFNIYKCLKGGKEISCPTDNNFTNIDKKEIQTTNNNYKLAIKYNTKEIYNGKLIETITKYITKTGDYNISITASTDNITSNIEFTTYIFN